MQSAEDVASVVWSFLSAAGTLVDRLDKEDEVKLLRLRTKKNELVIVPGTLKQWTRYCGGWLILRQIRSSFWWSYTTHHLHDTLSARTDLSFQFQRYPYTQMPYSIETNDSIPLTNEPH
jgi:hypothetical protein